MAIKKRLIDEVQEQEQIEERVEQEQQKEVKSVVKRPPVKQIISKDGAKDKQISAKVNMKMYEAFTKINNLQGISNNSAWNMLMTKYIRENKELLDDNIF